MRSKKNTEQSDEVRRRVKEITLTEAFHALALWLYNLSAEEKVEMVYGKDLHPSYKKEKMDTASVGFAVWWGCLDTGHRNALVDAVINRYGDEATKRRN